jgi:hypothetical protein
VEREFIPKRMFVRKCLKGVRYEVSADSEKNIVFLMNFTNEKKLVLPEPGKAGIDLEPFGVKILRS